MCQDFFSLQGNNLKPFPGNMSPMTARLSIKMAYPSNAVTIMDIMFDMIHLWSQSSEIQ